ncbi:2-methylcitrate dehydratase PrpD [Amycolatopsis pretoriensis]|uniref:2-methylcitrate dehydratase PrpD n=1 Tax=Amycolatopsis pretoriensis TaxID=218821 RepID=A0A1H5QD50_9PSEU|nr:MmgE/PrpD family protein [Amycolatopsis pretoriensis]SEF23929.1 2-methylcitrate dehydratase PrpD [Amycolatopsis pretoriensis]
MNREQAATADLGAWVAELDVPDGVADRLSLVLFDVVGVTALGASLPEQRSLAEAWRAPAGPAPLIGGGRCVTTDAAAWLNGVALVSLELDEGHKYAKGHPAAHGFPAVLALAAELDSTGADTAAALLAAYEVAARFGRATTLRPGAHPHGSWGVPGAAAGCARLLGLPPGATAAAIDTAAGLVIAGHFDSATQGNPVRNAWLGASATSGLAAARMAAAGMARNTGTAALSLGTLLGSLDAGQLTAELGTRWDITRGYFKRHASCSFTHPAADAVLELRSHPGFRAEGITTILVESHVLGAGLSSVDWSNRLSAMFSTPFVVATAARSGEIGPESPLDDAGVRALASRVRLVEAPDLTTRLPAERAARVTIAFDDGTSLVREVPNPVGDADHHPLTEPDVAGLLGKWLPKPFVDRAAALARDLASLPRVGAALRELAGTEEKEPN